MSLVDARAVLLRAHPYSESSRVLRFLTEARGLTGVMARGARRTGSTSTQGLDTFAEGDLTFYVKETRELQTLKHFTVTKPRRGIGRDPLRLAAASVIGEVVLRHAGAADTHALFGAVSRALDAVEEAERTHITEILLREGWGLVSSLGYQPVVEACVACGGAFGADDMGRFDFAQGGVLCPRCVGERVGPRVGPEARGQLAALLAGALPPKLRRPRAHLQLMSDFVTYHLADARPLETVRIFAALLPAADA